MKTLAEKYQIGRRTTLRSVRLVLAGLTIFSYPGISGLIEEKWYHQRETPMHKVQLTQKGYIQFLRWELPVPEITEFTFCLWMESNDLTHPHSIFSYSKNERDRLASSWISAQGKSVHLEIAGKQVFASSGGVQENRWYHVCVSWENRDGRYALWINGHIWAQGRSEETVGHKLPSGGDIVLGQEYTDFDKGLEEGIEGSVLGFNLLLASAFDSLDKGTESKTEIEESYDTVRLPSAFSYATVPLFLRIPTKVTQREGIDHEPRTRMGTRASDEFHLISNRFRGRRYAKSFLTTSTTNRTGTGTGRENSWPELFKLDKKEPYGLQLAKLSYVHCQIGRGSPFIGGPLMLISWTRTPVRLFGGATLKNVNSDCGNF